MRRIVFLSYDLLSTVTLFLLAVLFNYRAVFRGELFFERDTRVFYYPLHTWFAARLKRFELPLWSPDYFGGFPIFGDGESGMFYPPNALLTFVLPDDQAFIWNIVVHFFFAGIYTYCLIRALGLSRLSGILGGSAFMLSGFLVGQIHHQNLFDSAVWLPLILCFIERSARSTGMRRQFNLAFAGSAYGFQCLAVHPQVPLMSGLVIGLWVTFRWLLCPIAGGPPKLFVRHSAWQRGWWWQPFLEETDRLFAAARVVLGRLCLFAWSLCFVPAVAIGLSAAQLLPLYELGTFSRRAGGVDYAFATLHPQTTYNLITLLFPQFFRGPDWFYWGQWSEWETRIYVGIVPLLLAAVAVVVVRNRFVFFFLGLAVLALWMGMAANAPFFNLHGFLFQFPGFNQMRAPGRYALVFSLSAAVLAAYGFSWLEDHLRNEWRLRPAGPGSLIVHVPAAGGLWRPPLYAASGLLMVAAIELVLKIEDLHRVVLARGPDVEKWIARYVDGPRMLRLPDEALTPLRVEAGLRAALDPQGFNVGYTLVLLFAVIGVLYLWLAFRPLRRLWQGALIAILIADLAFTGWQFHPTVPTSALDSATPPIRFLASRQQAAPGRVFSRSGAITAPNILAGFGVPEANGYSSLGFSRHEEFVGALEVGYPHLLDAFAVRYVVASNRFVPLPSFEATPYNPTRPILSTVSALNGSAAASFTFDPFQATELRVISRLRNSAQLAQNTPVIEVLLTDANNRVQTYRLLAGVHTSEWSYDRPDVRAVVQHQKGRVAGEVRDTTGNVESSTYYAKFPLPTRTGIKRLEVRNISPFGDVQVQGITLVDEPRGGPVAFKRLLYDDLDRLKRIYEDADVVILENLKALPRAYLVPDAVIRPPTKSPLDVLNWMAEGAFNPRREVAFEEGDSPPLYAPTGKPAAQAGEVRWIEDEDMSIRLHVKSPVDQYLVLADAYYPDWKAMVDGVETKIYRANYLFRGIAVPSGEHEISFVYEPRSFWTGFRATLSTAAGLVVLWVLWRLGLLALLATELARAWHRRGGHWRTLPFPRPVERPVPPLEPDWAGTVGRPR